MTTIRTGYLTSADPPLSANDYITSPSNIYYAILQGDNNFVEYRGSFPVTSQPVWSTNTVVPDPLGSQAAQQPDGNFVVSTLALVNSEQLVWNPIFATNTSSNGQPSFAALGDDGAFTINTGTPANPGTKLFSNNFSDPVVSTDITSLTYDLASLTLVSSEDVVGASQICANDTPSIVTCTLSLALGYTKTDTFSFQASQSISLGFKSSTMVGVPGVGGETAEWSITGTIGFQEGTSKSDSETKTFSSTAQIPVPARSTYKAEIIGEQETADIPFTYTGIATHQSGATSPVTGSGTFTGTDSGLFTSNFTCIDSPTHCADPTDVLPPIPLPRAAVDEPSGALLLAMAMLAIAVVRWARRRAQPPARSSIPVAGIVRA
jgi:hypothetical protein